MTHTVLIANRGEIALRVIRTARDQGWGTVAVYTALDATARHRFEADVAVEVPSYLDIDAVVAAAKKTRATHVHPGYGFLSERAAFARALSEAGIVLLGPSAEVMDQMGRKDHAREVALAAGVPVVPSYDLSEDPATFAYPVLVKAAAGGGGKGMRVVNRVEEFAEALAAAQREAAKSFGDDTMLIEKYVASGRHIEVQVVGDTHGTVRHFYERDCSTQRRHQKVLEEAPAPTLTPAQREAVTAAGVALAAQVGYVGAGTVEFLLDNADGKFYFLEMNTRLQVEHPVTEEAVRVGGRPLDLVALQLQVGLGEPLGFSQDQVEIVGAAIEARVYAEDPFNGFLPQAGTATSVRWDYWVSDESDPSRDARVDEALESGQVVSTAFDPMLGKVIGIGSNRESARAALVESLGFTRIFGLTTNTGFLRALAASDEFRDAVIDTAWLDHNHLPAPDDSRPRLAAASAVAAAPVGSVDGPWRPDGWQPAGAPTPPKVYLDRWVEVDPHYVALETTRYPYRFVDHGDDKYAVLQGGLSVEVIHQGQRFVFTRPDPFGDTAAAAGDGTLTAPMPGTVLQVRVAEGDRVASGDTLGVMEAMKMELPLTAPFEGTVTHVGATEGSQVALGAVLFTVEALDA